MQTEETKRKNEEYFKVWDNKIKAKEKTGSRWYDKYPELKGKKILMYSGRLGKEKNLEFLLKVLRELMREIPDIILLYAGDGPYRSDLEKTVKKMGLAKNVVFTGFVVRSRMKELYALADIFVFASKTESQGLVTTEAMACKTPVVAIGIMGTRDVMNGDNGGFMVQDDLDEFTDKVRRLLTDPALYRKKSKEAYDYTQKWTIEHNALKMLELYKKYI